MNMHSPLNAIVAWAMIIQDAMKITDDPSLMAEVAPMAATAIAPGKRYTVRKRASYLSLSNRSVPALLFDKSMRVTLERMRMKGMAFGAMALLAAGCAKQPDQIAASPVATDRYLQMSCAELLKSKAAMKVEQVRLEQAQHAAAEHDKAAMGVIHIPVASLTGQDKEAEVARGKGELEAIEAAIQSNSCV